MSQGTIGWLLQFIRMDLQSLSKGQKSDLIAEVKIFATGQVTYASPGPRLLSVVNLGLWKSDVIDLVGNTRRVSDLIPRESAILELQAGLRKALNAYFTGPFRMRFPLPEGLAIIALNPEEYSEILADVPKEMETQAVGIEAKSFNDAFYYHAATLLSSYGSRLKQCKACQIIFAMNRTDQVYCSPLCMNRTKQQRYRERLRSQSD
jgi:hypothetical protein